MTQGKNSIYANVFLYQLSSFAHTKYITLFVCIRRYAMMPIYSPPVVHNIKILLSLHTETHIARVLVCVFILFTWRANLFGGFGTVWRVAFKHASTIICVSSLLLRYVCIFKLFLLYLYALKHALCRIETNSYCV